MAGKPLHYIPLYFTFRTHQKTLSLGVKLGSLPMARLAMVELWLYTCAYHRGGVIQADAIEGVMLYVASECGIAKTPAEMIGFFTASKIIDKGEFGEYIIHGWEDHAGVREAKNKADAVRIAKERGSCSGYINSQHPNVAATSHIGEESKVKESKVEEIKNPTPATPTASVRSPHEYSKEFEELWSIHNQGGKYAAFRAYTKVMKEAKDHAKLVQSLRNYIQWCKDMNNRMTCDLSTFFGLGRTWNEHIVPQKASSPEKPRYSAPDPLERERPEKGRLPLDAVAFANEHPEMFFPNRPKTPAPVETPK